MPMRMRSCSFVSEPYGGEQCALPPRGRGTGNGRVGGVWRLAGDPVEDSRCPAGACGDRRNIGHQQPQSHAAICRIRSRWQRPPALLHGMARLGWACQRDGGHAQCAADGVPWASMSRSAGTGNRHIDQYQVPRVDRNGSVGQRHDLRRWSGLQQQGDPSLQEPVRPGDSHLSPPAGRGVDRRRDTRAGHGEWSQRSARRNGADRRRRAGVGSRGRGAGRRMDGNECRETAQRDVVCERFSAVGQGDSSPDGPSAATSIFGPSLDFRQGTSGSLLVMGWTGLPGGPDHDNHLNIIFRGDDLQQFDFRRTAANVSEAGLAIARDVRAIDGNMFSAWADRQSRINAAFYNDLPTIPA